MNHPAAGNQTRISLSLRVFPTIVILKLIQYLSETCHDGNTRF